MEEAVSARSREWLVAEGVLMAEVEAEAEVEVESASVVSMGGVPLEVWGAVVQRIGLFCSRCVESATHLPQRSERERRTPQWRGVSADLYSSLD